VGVLSLLSHGIILGNEFVWDDLTLIVHHPEMGEPGFVGEILHRDYGLDYGEYRPVGYYRPFFVIMVWLQRQGFGLNPLGYRVVSLATLIGGAWLISLLAARWTGRWGAAYLAGALFACHPFKTETVTFVAMWPDLFLGGVLGATLWLSLAAVKSHGLRGKRAWILGGLVVCAAVAGLTKEAGLFGVVGLAAGLSAVGAAKRKRALTAGLALVLGLIAALWLRSGAELGGPKGAEALEALSAPFRASGAPGSLWAIGVSTGLWLLPRESIYIRNNPLSSGAGTHAQWNIAFQGGMILLGVGSIVLLALLIRKRRPLLASLTGWLLLGSYPLLLSTGMGMPYSERYVAVAPLTLLTALALTRWVRPLKAFPCLHQKGRLSRALVLAWIILGLCVVFSARGSARAMDPRSFWTLIVEDAPRSLYGHFGMAKVFYEEGDLPGMEQETELVFRQAPRAKETGDLVILLGGLAIRRGEPEIALQWYDRELAEVPNRKVFLQGRSVALHLLGRHEEARKTIDAACASHPTDETLQYTAARIYVSSPDVAPEIALERVRRAAEVSDRIPEQWQSTSGIRESRQAKAREGSDAGEAGATMPSQQPNPVSP